MSTRDKGAKAQKGADQASTDNRSRQLNPNNVAYWRSRGEDSRPARTDGKSDKKR